MTNPLRNHRCPIMIVVLLSTAGRGAYCAGLRVLTDDPTICHQLSCDNPVGLYQKS